MPSNHEIIITNFTQNEIVYYPVIIIKGIIKNTSKCEKQSNEIFINSNSFQILHDKFKGLIELKLGGNKIIINYCCVETIINLNYRKRHSKFSVLPLYIVCKGHDGKFQAPETVKNDVESARKRITLGAKLLQSIIAEKLHEENLGRKTFKLEDDCRVFLSNLDYHLARKTSQEELWNSIGSEIINSSDLDHERIKFLGFLSCTKYCGQNYEENSTHEDIVKMTEAYVALGGGGLALFGTACLYTWPEKLSQVIGNFENLTPIDRRNFMDDSNYRGTLGACFSTTLGSVLHELCHTFDLGHTKKGIMGRGFDDVNKVFMVNEDVKSVKLEENFERNLFTHRFIENKLISVKNYNRKKEEDSTFWTRSCLYILAYHKWFNDFDSFGDRVIKFDPVSKFVSSSSGIRVIEVRDEVDGMVFSDWTFDSRILKYSFQLPENLDFGQRSVIIVVEDNIGNIFKCNLETQ